MTYQSRKTNNGLIVGEPTSDWPERRHIERPYIVNGREEHNLYTLDVNSDSDLSRATFNFMTTHVQVKRPHQSVDHSIMMILNGMHTPIFEADYQDGQFKRLEVEFDDHTITLGEAITPEDAHQRGMHLNPNSVNVQFPDDILVQYAVKENNKGHFSTMSVLYRNILYTVGVPLEKNDRDMHISRLYADNKNAKTLHYAPARMEISATKMTF